MYKLTSLVCLTFLLLGGASLAPAQTTFSGPLCIEINAVDVLAHQGFPDYDIYRLRLYYAEPIPGFALLLGDGSNRHGDAVPLHGSATHGKGDQWAASLMSTLQTFDGRGYYLLSLRAEYDVGTGLGTAYLGNVDVSIVGGNDYNRPVEAPLPATITTVECGK